jgi:hypothetical protein
VQRGAIPGREGASLEDWASRRLAGGEAPVSVPVLADESRAFRHSFAATGGGSQAAIVVYWVGFRKGNAVAWVDTGAPAATARLDEALRLAHMVESRIR